MPDLIRLDLVAEEEDMDNVTGILVRRVSYGWEEESLPTGESLFRVHCEHPEMAEAICAEVAARAPAVRIARSQIPQQDWALAWRDFFTPVAAGDFLVLPPWLLDKGKPILPDEDPRLAEGRHLLIIEPKSAFGTGHHNTTALCLEAITALSASQNPLSPGMRFFDVGTGTGILGIACAKLGLTGLGTDIDPVAVANARENIAINQVESSLAIVPGSVEAAGDERFDLILANILAQPLKDLAPDIIRRLKKGGRLILSGLLQVQAEAVEAAYAPLGPARRLNSGDWVALIWG